MKGLRHDLSVAWRHAWQQPATSLLIVVTLALGIGLNSAVFSATWRLLLAPLPYRDAAGLVLLDQQRPAIGRTGIRWSQPTIDDIGAMSTTLTDLASYEQQPHIIAGHGEPWSGDVGIASANLFSLLGIAVQYGRDFTADDNQFGNEPVMLLSHDFWLRQFGGDPAAIGTTLRLTDMAYRVVGVLPDMPAWPHRNDVWVTHAGDPYRLHNLTRAYDRRGAQILSHVVARLRAGATLDEASVDLATTAQRLIASYPDTYAADYTLAVTPLTAELTRDARATFLLLLGLTALVVLIASANVASLQLVRLTQRGQELAIREALGAPPGRITRQLLSENLLFATAGTLLGLLLAWPLLQLLARFAVGYSPLAGAIGFDRSVWLSALGTALLTWVVSGLAPSLGRHDINTALKEGGAKTTLSPAAVRVRQALMLTQFALAFAALTSAALIVLSLRRLDDQDTGYDAEHVLALSIPLNLDLRAGGYPPQMLRFGRQLLDQVQALPGVAAAGLYTGSPMLQDASFLTAFPVLIEGIEQADTDSNPRATIRAVSEDYFATLGIPLREGRLFNRDDDADAAPVAIINEATARLFPDGKAVGGRIRVTNKTEWREVVGVVAEVRANDLDSLEGPVLYHPFWQWPAETQHLYVRTDGEPALLTAAVTDIVHGIDADQAIETLKPLGELRQDWLAPIQLRAVMITLSGLLALGLALSGVVGVVGYNVSQRVREIGIRMAVGAPPARVTRLFVVEGLQLCGAGLVLGLGLMLAAAPLLQPLLYETSAYDVGAYAASALLLVLAALAAGWVPARQAGRLNPTDALRSD